jgi:hypothetical protein
MSNLVFSTVKLPDLSVNQAMISGDKYWEWWTTSRGEGY